MYRSLVVAVLAISFLPSTVWADEIPDDLKPQVERLKAMQPIESERLKAEIKQLWSRLIGLTEYEYKRRRQEIDEKYRQIKELERSGIPPCSIDCLKLIVGQIGWLDAKKLTVSTVFNDKLEVQPTKKVFREGATYPHEEQGRSFMLYGLPTNGIADGHELKPRILVEVVGTEPRGGSTLLKVQYYDVARLRPYLKNTDADDNKDGKQHKPTSSQRPLRTWTDASSKFSIKATFAGSVAGKVRLRKEDKSIIEVDLDKLSPEDQSYVKTLNR